MISTNTMEPPIGQAGRIAYGLAMGMLGSISVFGYAVYLRAIWRRGDLQKRSIFIMSLCLSDLVLIFGHMISTVVASFFRDWPFGDAGCQMNAFFGMGVSLITIGNIALISYDVYKRECEKEQDYSNYGFYIAAVWIVGTIVGLLPIFGLGKYGYESDLRAGCLMDYKNGNPRDLSIYIGIIATVFFVLPIFKLVQYYHAVYKKTGNGFLLKVVPAQMICSWTPYAIFSVLTLILGPANIPQVSLVMICNLSAKICIASNPYIYIMSDSKLKLACHQLVFGKGRSVVDFETKEKTT